MLCRTWNSGPHRAELGWAELDSSTAPSAPLPSLAFFCLHQFFQVKIGCFSGVSGLVRTLVLLNRDPARAALSQKGNLLLGLLGGPRDITMGVPLHF